MAGKPVTSAVLDPSFDLREAAASLPLERLEAEITQLAGNLAAAECRWLLLVAEFDRRRGWEQWGCRSITHWLGWHCALDERAAREKVRVARALTEFTLICERFAQGRLSYSKVRAITRISTPETEADLVDLAEHATAAQVERLVAGYRRTFDPNRQREADERHTKQDVQWFTDDDGSIVMKVRWDPEDAALVRGAIEAAADHSVRQRPREQGETIGMRRAAVLRDLIIVAAGSEAVPMDAADRYLVMVNVDESVLTNDDGIRCELDGGPGLPAETARRLACDASCVPIVRDALSQVVDVGRKTRVIPRWMRRQLHARDGGCVFPGCPERRIVIGHHVRHWTRGGETELYNLIELCAYHHRLVHEGGWTVTFDGVRQVTFFQPDATPVVDACRATGSAEPFAADLEPDLVEQGTHITADTITSKWYGDPLDLGLILPALSLTLEKAGRYVPVRTRVKDATLEE